jgi:hypothetical protein
MAWDMQVKFRVLPLASRGASRMSQPSQAGRAETLGVGAMVFGLLSLGLCWWFPFGAVLGGSGVGFGVYSRLIGKSRSALIGTLFSTGGITASMLLTPFFWNHLLGM